VNITREIVGAVVRALGGEPPAGDSAKCRELANFWDGVGYYVESTVVTQVDWVAGQVHANNSGLLIDAFVAYLKNTVGFDLGEAQKTAYSLRDALNKYADAIDGAWNALTTQVAEAAAGLFVIAAFAFVTAGIASWVASAMSVAEAAAILGVCTWFDTTILALGQTMTYYLADSVVWAAMDTAGQGIADLATGADPAKNFTPQSLGSEFVANMAYDRVLDRTATLIDTAGRKYDVLGEYLTPVGGVAPDANGDVAARFLARMSGSTTFTVVYNAANTGDPSLPTDQQWDIKVLGHGMRAFPEAAVILPKAGK
jgi:hypothetical protein